MLGTCLEYAWNMLGISMNMLGICLEYARSMLGINMNMLGISRNMLGTQTTFSGGYQILHLYSSVYL